MARSKYEVRETYQAKDAVGKVYTINVVAELEDISNSFFSEPAHWIVVSTSHQMAGTKHVVNVNDDGTLQEVATGLKMTRLP